MPEIKPEIEALAKIKVVGIGGGGGAAVNRMISADIRGVEFIAINTDIQALQHSRASVKLHIGKQLTKGLGSGMNPEVGRKAAEENSNEIRDLLKGADMVFITCGLGGGTGSGAGAVVAQIAKECGALTVAVVTKPFSFEQSQRQEIADRAHEELVEHVDTIITVNNDRVLDIVDKNTSLMEAFRIVDDVLLQGVQGISEVISVHANINVDFADVRAIMQDAGSALMGMGRASGENKAVEAAKAAIASPLLDISIDGAKGILFVITGSSDLGIHEVNEAAKIITGSADESAKVIFGACIDEKLKDEVRITVIATGFGDFKHARSKPKADPFAVPRVNYFGAQAVAPQVREVEREASRKVFPTFETPFKKKEPIPVKRDEVVVTTSSSIQVAPLVATGVESPEIKELIDENVDLEIPTFLRRKIR